ncbi:MAG TPA: Wzz/FepE/Etk N-terminal domain-containing protein [Deinococcales bacterium]|nr:Wzz/FepE/Etk N-terminal domain-containing protein [Deinococcales bacterium]
MQELSLVDVIRTLRRHAALVATILLTGLLAGVLVALTLPKGYRASAQVYLAPPRFAPVINGRQQTDPNPLSPPELASLAASNTVLQATETQLALTPGSLPRQGLTTSAERSDTGGIVLQLTANSSTGTGTSALVNAWANQVAAAANQAITRRWTTALNGLQAAATSATGTMNAARARLLTSLRDNARLQTNLKRLTRATSAPAAELAQLQAEATQSAATQQRLQDAANAATAQVTAINTQIANLNLQLIASSTLASVFLPAPPAAEPTGMNRFAIATATLALAALLALLTPFVVEAFRAAGETPTPTPAPRARRQAATPEEAARQIG